MAPQGQSEDRQAIAAAWASAYGRYDPVEALALHARIRRTLGRVIEGLAAHGVEVLPVKGALLASTAYARPVDRPLRDVDVKVRARDLAETARFLRTARGGRLVRFSRLGANVVGQLDRVEVDVEARVGPPLVCALAVDALFARAERTRDGLGFEHLRIDPTDHALLLAVDRFKDHVGHKPWAAWDLARIVRDRRFDAARFAARAREARCTTIVHVVAREMADVHGDEAWSELVARVPAARPRLAARVLERLRAETPATLAARIDARGASDSRARAVGAVLASAAWSVSGYGGVTRDVRR